MNERTNQSEGNKTGEPDVRSGFSSYLVLSVEVPMGKPLEVLAVPGAERGTNKSLFLSFFVVFGRLTVV